MERRTLRQRRGGGLKMAAIHAACPTLLGDVSRLAIQMTTSCPSSTVLSVMPATYRMVGGGGCGVWLSRGSQVHRGSPAWRSPCSTASISQWHIGPGANPSRSTYDRKHMPFWRLVGLPKVLEFCVTGIDVHIPGPRPTIGTVIPAISALLEDVLKRERGVDGPDAILGAASAIEQ